MDKNPLSLKKTFATLGEVEYKIASTPQELEGALSLVYHEYTKRHLIRKENYKHGLRISPQHILPETTVFIGLKKNEVIITLSTFRDSPLGIPMDTGYHEEVQRLRDQGRKFAEPGYLAIKGGMFGGKKSLLKTVEKIHFICTIFQMAIQYGLYHTDVDDACLVTNPNPKQKFFKYFPLETMGEEKSYGFDQLDVDPLPAIAKRLDFRAIRQSRFHIRNIILKLAMGPRMPASLFRQRLKMTKEDVLYFLEKKSDILKNLRPAEADYIRSCYNI